MTAEDNRRIVEPEELTFGKEDSVADIVVEMSKAHLPRVMDYYVRGLIGFHNTLHRGKIKCKYYTESGESRDDLSGSSVIGMRFEAVERATDLKKGYPQDRLYQRIQLDMIRVLIPHLKFDEHMRLELGPMKPDDILSVLMHDDLTLADLVRRTDLRKVVSRHTSYTDFLLELKDHAIDTPKTAAEQLCHLSALSGTTIAIPNHYVASALIDHGNVLRAYLEHHNIKNMFLYGLFGMEKVFQLYPFAKPRFSVGSLMDFSEKKNMTTPMLRSLAELQGELAQNQRGEAPVRGKITKALYDRIVRYSPELALNPKAGGR